MNKKDKDLVSIVRGSVSNSDFTKSIHFDKRLYKQDILSSQVHALVLEKLGILDEKERVLEKNVYYYDGQGRVSEIRQYDMVRRGRTGDREIPIRVNTYEYE